MVTNKEKLKFIAEIGLNHNGSIDLAKKHIEAAKEAGATTAKFQTYFTESRAKENSPIYEILKQCELNAEQFSDLASFCDDLDIEFASTPFCKESFKILNQLNCSFIKIASFHLTNYELLDVIFRESIIKEIIISTGVSSFNDIKRTNQFYESLKEKDKPRLTFMHCVSEYPISSLENLNLINILEIAKLTGKEVGFSDHSKGFIAPTYSVSLGARVIEKHFTLDNSLEGADHAMSSNINDFKVMVDKCKDVLKILGEKRSDNIHYERENNSTQFCVKTEI